HRSRKIEARRVATLRELLELRAARVSEVQERGSLVERFARRVVERLAEERVTSDRVHAHELRVATRDEERDERKFGRGIAEQRREQVALEMMDAHHRALEREAEPGGDRSAHEQRAGEPRT